jgi:cell wall-associated NlpC family hydrolase
MEVGRGIIGATRPRARARVVTVVTATTLALLWSPVSSLGDLHRDLSTSRQTATALRAAIIAETKRIAATGAGVRDAQARLAQLQSQVSARQAQLDAVQRDVVSARKRLERLENRQRLATRLLAANLVAGYKDPDPDVVSVVLSSHGFADMLEQLNFMRRVERRNARILSNTKAARIAVLAEARHLTLLQARIQSLTAEVINARNDAAAVEGALLIRQSAQLQKRAHTSARLTEVRGRISALKKRIVRLSRAVRTAPAAAPTTPVPGLPTDPGGLAQAPAGAPAAVRQVIAAGNAIAGLPYAYGGGHGSFHANAYDCSGSVSYALAAAGLLSSPLDSTGFESWGEPGPGKWITVYANAGHAFMVVAGWRFDTSALGPASTRWTRAMRDTGGFVARHPAGL